MSATSPAIKEIPRPNWSERLKALRNIPPVMRIVWDAAPGVVISTLFFRLVAALIPLSILAVTRFIIDSVNQLKQTPLPHIFWWMVLLEFVLAGVATFMARIIEFCDTKLADRFTRHIGIRLMKHAAKLDLMSYEDPVFYDKLERARVQSTDRVQMIQVAGRLIQELITTVTLAAAIFLFSKLLLLALVVCIVPVFLGETHFAFMNYSLSFQQTPDRRELEYLRVLGGTKESAKELKLFGLAPFLVGRLFGFVRRAVPPDFGPIETPAHFRNSVIADRLGGILRELYVRHLRDGNRHANSRKNGLSFRRHRRREWKPAIALYYFLRYYQSSAVYDGPAGIFRGETEDRVQSFGAGSTQTDPYGIRIQKCFVQISRESQDGA